MVTRAYSLLLSGPAGPEVGIAVMVAEDSELESGQSSAKE